MKTVLIGIARMNSTRLPGKVLRTLGDKSVLGWIARAANSASGVDDVWIATTTRADDNAIEAWCYANNINCFRGSEHDVLSRFLGAAEMSNADVAVRVTCDCPFIDPAIIGAVVRLQKNTGCDYASNVEPRTWPDGTDTEAITIKALRQAARHATRAIDRECVTTFIARNRHSFPAEGLVCPIPGLHKERWTMDTADDFQFCSEVAQRLESNVAPSYLDILSVLDQDPWIRDCNKHHPTNERYYEALAQEEIVPRSYARSQILLKKAEEIIPLGAQTFSKSRLQFPQPSPLFISHGQGASCWDIDGNEYVDLVSALLPCVLGHRDPNVDQAIRRQLQSGISLSLATELETSLAERLRRLIPCAEAIRFGKNGSDATSAAVRLARAHTGRTRILSHGYHGWHDWAVTGTQREKGANLARVTNLGTTSIDFIEYEIIRAAKERDHIAGLIIEPEGWDITKLNELKSVCNKHGVVLIFDEVITGFRWHLGGAQAYYEVTPDLACFGKAMANGMPLSAVVGRKDIMKLMAPPDNIFYSGTFFGETLSLAAAIATIDKMEKENVIAKLWSDGAQLRKGAEALVYTYGLEKEIQFYGEDPLVRIKFKDDKVATIFRRHMIDAGVLIISSHNVCYALTQNEIKRVLKAYDYTLDKIKEAGDLTDLEMETVTPTVRQS